MSFCMWHRQYLSIFSIYKKMLRFISLGIIAVFLAPIVLFAQTEKKIAAEELEQQLIEYLETIEAESTDFNELLELFYQIIQKPINLNKDPIDPLIQLGFLEDHQVKALLHHIEVYGPLISYEELQSIPSWSTKTIRQLRPLVKVSGQLDDLQIGTKELLKALRYSMFVYAGRNFPEDPNAAKYEGGPFRQFVRLRAQYGYSLSAGINMEKDAGEAIFKGSNPFYDEVNFHLYAKRYKQWLEAVCFGDFRISLGQGLIMHNGFGGNKSAQVNTIKKDNRFLRPHTSLAEYNYNRGIAADFNLGKRFGLGLFYSNKRRDANLVLVQDSIENREESEFTAIQTSGLHRTEGELEDEKSIRNQTYGGRLQYESNTTMLAFNLVQNTFDQAFKKSSRFYQQYNFTGERLLQYSISYEQHIGSWKIFGESAQSEKVWAHLIGIKSSAAKNFQWSGLFRYYPKDYNSIFPNVFGERRGAKNEIGLYQGLTWQISPKHQLFAYVDFWQHPWILSNADGPSSGEEYLLKYRFYLKRKLEAYIIYRQEQKQLNSSSKEPGYTPLVTRIRNQVRMHLNYKVNQALEWRTRIEFNRVAFPDTKSNGFLLYQDFVYKPISSSLSFTARYCLFDTDNYDSRIYTYENNLLYVYSLPALAGKGQRYYLNLRWRPLKMLTLEARIARTDYWNELQSLEAQVRQSKTELAVQCRMVF